MKTFKKNSSALFAAFLMSVTFSSAIDTPVINVDVEDYKASKPAESELLGSWEYAAENAPDKYKVGALSIFHENGENNVFVQLDEREILGTKVNLVGNTISFEVTLEGTVFAVKLTAKGEALTGTYTSADGTFQIKGARVKIM
ncbi:hypothetical protein [Zobellia russellii]|uniref:hypothetical protein n=1 Tax=Zobellia russellii TaxID=248907 RepID=UPI0037DC4023